MEYVRCVVEFSWEHQQHKYTLNWVQQRMNIVCILWERKIKRFAPQISYIIVEPYLFIARSPSPNLRFFRSSMAASKDVNEKTMEQGDFEKVSDVNKRCGKMSSTVWLFCCAPLFFFYVAEICWILRGEFRVKHFQYYTASIHKGNEIWSHIWN